MCKCWFCFCFADFCLASIFCVCSFRFSRMAHFWRLPLPFQWWCLLDSVSLWPTCPVTWNGAVIYHSCDTVSKDLWALFMAKIEKHWTAMQCTATTGKFQQSLEARGLDMRLLIVNLLASLMLFLNGIISIIFVAIFKFHFPRYPQQFLSEISMRGDQFWPCLNALFLTVLLLRLGAYFLLRWKLIAVRWMVTTIFSIATYILAMTVIYKENATIQKNLMCIVYYQNSNYIRKKKNLIYK